MIIHKGSEEKPAVIFIHGLGMDKDVWVNPLDSRILGGKFPLTVMLNQDNQSETIQTLFDDLRLREYPVITWSQQRPSGPISYALKELNQVIQISQDLSKAGIILIGHSRGGLIGRKYLLQKDRSIKGLITISTPHKGSSIARIVSYLSPLASLLNTFIAAGKKGTSSYAIKKIIEFLKSRALKELLPESNFFKSLKDYPHDWIYYASAGGTNPTLFRFDSLSFPDILEKAIPRNLYPEEIKTGKGDGLVSAESSKIPWSHEHQNFPCNHAEILFDENARDTLGKIIEKIR